MSSTDKTLTASKAGKRGGRPSMYDEPMDRKRLSAPAIHWEHLKSTYGGYSKGLRTLIERDMASEDVEE